MDCENFDRVVLDLLYDELDELTSAAAKRHMDHCTRCRDISSGLRATRDVGVLPMIEAPEYLEARILQAERDANAVLPLRKRLGRAVSIMASYAMRPQLAMAALLLLMIGSSLLFLRARPGERESVHVTERGVPEREGKPVTIVPMPGAGSDIDKAGAPSHGVPDKAARRKRSASSHDERAGAAPAASPAPGAAPGRTARGYNMEKTANVGAVGELGSDAGANAYDQAMAAYRTGRYAEAQRRFDDVAAAGGSQAASAALYAALAARNSTGCRTAAPRFDTVSSRYGGSSVASQATWQAADCYRNMGDNDRARRHYTALLSTPGYAERARAAIGALDSGSGPAVASRHVAAEAAKPAAAPAKARATTTRPAKPPTKTKASRPPVKVDEPGASDQMP